MKSLFHVTFSHGVPQGAVFGPLWNPFLQNKFFNAYYIVIIDFLNSQKIAWYKFGFINYIKGIFGVFTKYEVKI